MSASDFEARLRRIGAERYHHRHPFNLRMHAGELSRAEIQSWVRNRYYYQTRIPIKDGLILAKAADPGFRRGWVRRIRDHDGDEERVGGLELWLSLASAVGLDRREVESQSDVLPGVRAACDDYVRFVESHDLLESVAASLTELFAGDIMQTRIDAFERHYPWVDTAGLRYFQSRTQQAPRDAAEGLGFVLEHARSAADQDRCAAALERKCEILWRLLDAIEAAHARPRVSPHAQLREEAGGLLIVLPERAVKPSESGREILALCDGERSAVEIAQGAAATPPGRAGARERRPRVSREHARAGRARAGRLRAMSAPRPYNLVAELTYRCPLRCAYCSNPVGYREIPDALDTQAWRRVFREAAALGVVHVGLTGGEPSARSDLRELVAGAAEAGLYTHLVTAGTPLSQQGLAGLREAGLRSVQLSLQDTQSEDAAAVAGARVLERKLACAAWVRAEGLPLTLNVVLHRRNLGRVPELVALARSLDADRLELANTQYHGWALVNRDGLLPSRAQLEAAARAVAAARRESARPEIVFVLPDYFAGRPKPCMGGWGQRTLVVAPDGRVLPCHAAASLPGLEFWNVQAEPLARCWSDAPGMNAFRGEAWLPEPCRSCAERTRDFGGCRCQAFALTGEAAATDPACELAPRFDLILAARRAAEANEEPLVLRGER